MNFQPYLLVTGEKKQRSESNDSDKSDEEDLPKKQEVSKKHKSFESGSYDISIGHGKQPASGKSYQRLALDNSALLSRTSTYC